MIGIAAAALRPFMTASKIDSCAAQGLAMVATRPPGFGEVLEVGLCSIGRLITGRLPQTAIVGVLAGQETREGAVPDSRAVPPGQTPFLPSGALSDHLVHSSARPALSMVEGHDDLAFLHALNGTIADLAFELPSLRRTQRWMVRLEEQLDRIQRQRTGVIHVSVGAGKTQTAIHVAMWMAARGRQVNVHGLDETMRDSRRPRADWCHELAHYAYLLDECYSNHQIVDGQHRISGLSPLLAGRALTDQVERVYNVALSIALSRTQRLIAVCRVVARHLANRLRIRGSAVLSVMFTLMIIAARYRFGLRHEPGDDDRTRFPSRRSLRRGERVRLIP
jgi:hypothetical protein